MVGLNRMRGRDRNQTLACTKLPTARYNAKAHVNRGVLLMEGGRLDDARDAFSSAAAIEPLLPQALYNLG